MSLRSIKKLIADDLICATQHVYAALPPRCAVRLRLTEAPPVKISGGYASVSLGAARRQTLAVTVIAAALVFQLAPLTALAKKRVPPGGRVAVVVDERLSALRAAPDLTAKLLERLSRGHLVSIRGEKVTADGLKFYRVALSSRTFGWLQSDAVVVPWRAGDDRRLLTLIENSDEFDRIVRAKTFLDVFPQSLLRPKALAMYATEAEETAEKLTRDAGRRFSKTELPPIGVPEFSYYLNYNGLDRYNREGITFLFDRTTKKFSYNGAAWREILKRYPNSSEAVEARKHLDALATVNVK
jgi:hypothetical protein